MAVNPLVASAEVRPTLQSVGRPLPRRILQAALGALDFALILAAAVAAFWLHVAQTLDAAEQAGRYLAVGGAGAAAAVQTKLMLGGYRWTNLTDRRFQLAVGPFALALVLLALAAIAFLAKASDDWSRGWAVGWLVGGGAALALGRLALDRMLRIWAEERRLDPVVVVLGDPERAGAFIDELENQPVRILGAFSDRPEHVGERVDAGAPVGPVGSIDDLLDAVRSQAVDHVVITIPMHQQGRLLDMLERLSLVSVGVRLALDLGRITPLARTLSELGGQPLIHLSDPPLTDVGRTAKRALDLAVATAAMLVAGPLMLATAAAIKLESPGPVFFRQKRYGLNNAVIEVLKFRSMRTDRQDVTGAAQTVAGDPRVTRVGRFIRRWSIDELPQLINVLRGDMSIVGPRAHPLVMYAGGRRYEDMVSNYLMRHRVKPGITGWAQVNGLRGPTTDAIAAIRRVEHDLEYIESWSIWFDLKIILRTVGVVLKGDNAF